MSLSENKMSELTEKAKEARRFSFSPYSNFSVGAALLGKDGKIFTGCNIESAVFTPGICAERAALFKAISEGQKEFSAMAIVGGKNNENKIQEFCPPCGVCRQVLSEFCDCENFEVILYDGAHYKLFKLKDLLPERFELKV